MNLSQVLSLCPLNLSCKPVITGSLCNSSKAILKVDINWIRAFSKSKSSCKSGMALWGKKIKSVCHISWSSPPANSSCHQRSAHHQWWSFKHPSPVSCWSLSSSAFSPNLWFLFTPPSLCLLEPTNLLLTIPVCLCCFECNFWIAHKVFLGQKSTQAHTDTQWTGLAGFTRVKKLEWTSLDSFLRKDTSQESLPVLETHVTRVCTCMYMYFVTWVCVIQVSASPCLK